MSFDIGFTDCLESDTSSNTTFRQGRIRIGHFSESFVSALTFWTDSQYLEHWHDAVRRVTYTGQDSCLITSIADPLRSEMLFWWPMYREGDQVIIQNGLLFFSELERSFDPTNPFETVPERVMLNEDGQRVLEWVVTVQDLEDFLDGGGT